MSNKTFWSLERDLAVPQRGNFIGSGVKDQREIGLPCGFLGLAW